MAGYSPDVARYHPLLVALHWIIAALILGNLAAGLLVLDPTPNSAVGKVDLLRLHFLTGLTILALMAVRLVTRLATSKPPIPHEKGPLRWLAIANHWGLYLFTFAMLSTGLGMTAPNGILPAVLGGGPVELPASFAQLPPHAGHALFSTVLLVLIGLHLAGNAYHYLVRRENLLSRMWFGPRKRAEGAGPTHAPQPSAR